MNVKITTVAFLAMFAFAGAAAAQDKMSTNSMKTDAMKADHMKADHMKGDAMKGDAMKADHMKGDAMKGDTDEDWQISRRPARSASRWSGLLAKNQNGQRR